MEGIRLPIRCRQCDKVNWIGFQEDSLGQTLEECSKKLIRIKCPRCHHFFWIKGLDLVSEAKFYMQNPDNIR